MKRIAHVFVLASVALLASASSFAERVQFAVIGDAGRWNSNAQSVRDSMLRQGVRRTILPGDNLYNPLKSYEDTWAGWTSMGVTFDVPAIGNHHGGYEREVRFFGMPAQFYAKVIAGARFIVLNSDNMVNVQEQMAFLETELTQATESVVFLVYHHPTFTVSGRHRWTEKKAFQLAIRPLLKRFRSKLTGLIVGHDHLATALSFDGIPVILSGAVQEARGDKPVDNTQDGWRVKTEYYFDSKPTWIRLTVDSESPEVQVEFVRAKDDRLGCTMRLAQGRAAGKCL